MSVTMWMFYLSNSNRLSCYHVCIGGIETQRCRHRKITRGSCLTFPRNSFSKSLKWTILSGALTYIQTPWCTSTGPIWEIISLSHSDGGWRYSAQLMTRFGGRHGPTFSSQMTHHTCGASWRGSVRVTRHFPWKELQRDRERERKPVDIKSTPATCSEETCTSNECHLNIMSFCYCFSAMLTIGRFVRAESSKNCSTFSRSAAAHTLQQYSLPLFVTL